MAVEWASRVVVGGSVLQGEAAVLVLPAAAEVWELELVPSAGRASADWAAALVRSAAVVSSAVPLHPRAQVSRRRGSAAPATVLPPPPPAILAWRERICAAPTWDAGCSAIAPSATWLCDRTSLRPDSKGGSSVRPGHGGVAASSSAGSDRCSGPTPITTSSITCIGLTPTTTSGRMPTTTSTTASMAVTPMPAALSAPGRNGSSAPRRTARPSGGSERRAAEVCSDSATDLTDWPIERISEVVQPTDAQRPALDELRAANAKAIDILKAGCPKDLPEHSDRTAGGDGEPAAGHAAGGADRASGARPFLSVAQRRTEGALQRRRAGRRFRRRAKTSATSPSSATRARPG